MLNSNKSKFEFFDEKGTKVAVFKKPPIYYTYPFYFFDKFSKDENDITKKYFGENYRSSLSKQILEKYNCEICSFHVSKKERWKKGQRVKYELIIKGMPILKKAKLLKVIPHGNYIEVNLTKRKVRLGGDNVYNHVTKWYEY